MENILWYRNSRANFNEALPIWVRRLCCTSLYGFVGRHRSRRNYVSVADLADGWRMVGVALL